MRVVVTGMGALTPLGAGVPFTWKRLTQGVSGIQKITQFDTTDLACTVAGHVPLGSDPGQLDLNAFSSAAERRQNDTFILFALAAAQEAFEDANWHPQTPQSQERTGALIGSGIGGLPMIEQTVCTLKDRGARRVSPFFIPGSLINLASGQVSIRHGLKGPNYSIVTACASGAHAIGEAAHLIARGDADVMLAGGAEAAICRLGVAGFSSLRALSTQYNDKPEEASRPWDTGRDGFVMGEGAGLLVLESLEHAQKRGAKIYGEVAGYGLSGDAYHVAAPDGEGGKRAMRQALATAKIAPEEIDYINAHGTSTPLGDAMELSGIHDVFGAHTAHMMVSSTKSSIGHLLGAAGGVEAVFALKTLETGVVPPTLNLHDCSEETNIDLVPLTAKEKRCAYVMSNSFGFGGTNASLIFKAFED